MPFFGCPSRGVNESDYPVVNYPVVTLLLIGCMGASLN